MDSVTCFLYGMTYKPKPLSNVIPKPLTAQPSSDPSSSLGRCIKGKYSIKIHIILTVVAVILTACFTLIDDVITPIMYSYSAYATKLYFTASLTVMIPQMICSLATVSTLFYPLYKVLILAKKWKKELQSQVLFALLTFYLKA